jgi:hypothetical protein
MPISKYRQSRRRNGAQSGTVEPNQRGTIEPITNGTIEPITNGTIEPNQNGILEPNQNGILEPNQNGTIEPNQNGTIEPNQNGTIEPNRNGTIEPNQNGTIEPSQSVTIEPNQNGTIEPNRSGTKNISGRRIVSFKSLNMGIQDIAAHCKQCVVAKLQLDLERRSGLSSEFVFKCTCGWVAVISSNDDCNSLPINDSFAWGCESAPVGFTAATSLLTTMDIPTPDFRTFQKSERKCKDLMEVAFRKEMEENLLREKELAIAANEYVFVEGIKYARITVCVDCGWCKRSYGHSYTANCGVGVIIGVRTGRIIYAGTRCSTCLICDKHARSMSKGPVPPHKCPKNWSGPATAMETDIIRQGFLESRAHGLVYTKFIGDGDSSVHAAVENIYPGIKVKKIECKNHLYKNLTKKNMALAMNKITGKKGVTISVVERRHLNHQLHRIPIAIKMAVKHYMPTKTDDTWKELQKDILNIPYHIFGRHNNCKSYFCNPQDPSKSDEVDSVTEMMSCSFWVPLEKAVKKIADESFSLMEDETSNAAENFMSVANTFIEGKRKNFGQSGLYRHRILAAVFSYNNCSFWPTKIYSTLFGKAPSTPWRNRYAASYRKRCRKEKPKAARKINFPIPSAAKGDKNYGSNPTKPDFSDVLLAEAISSLKESLKVTAIQQQEIQEATLRQSDDPLWKTERLKRITASNAHIISRLGRKTDNTGTLNKHFGRRQFHKLIPLMEYGKEHEQKAINAYEVEKRLAKGTVKKCGLVVSLENGIFAASPDGLLGDDGLVEVKCPPSISDYDPKLWPLFAPKTSWLERRGDELKLKLSHPHLSQIIMQIYVTDRQWCDYFIWTPKGHHVERIHRNEETDKEWTKMKGNMEFFWENDLAPELVDSRFERGYNEYRYPSCRHDAVQKKKSKQQAVKRALAADTEVDNDPSDTDDDTAVPRSRVRLPKKIRVSK